MCLFKLILKRDFFVSFLASICVNTVVKNYFETEKVLNKLTSLTICLLDNLILSTE